MVDTKKYLQEIDILLTENPLVKYRLQGLAPIGLTKNNSYGISGANLRAAGVPQDLRFSGDYLIYRELRIEAPPLITFGDCAWGRYLQRIFEIEQSIDMIQAVIGSLPKGAASIPVGLDFSAAKGEWLESIEGPRGVIYCWVQTDGGRNPARVKFATPSYSSLRLVPKILRSLRVDDLWLAMASLDLSISEVDR